MKKAIFCTVNKKEFKKQTYLLMFTKRTTGRINWKTIKLITNRGWGDCERDRGGHDIFLSKCNFFVVMISGSMLMFYMF